MRRILLSFTLVFCLLIAGFSSFAFADNWYEKEVQVISSSSFQEETVDESYGIFQYKVPASMLRKLSASFRYYYPPEYAGSNFLMASLVESGVDYESMSNDEALVFLTVCIDNLIKTDSVQNATAFPAEVNGRQAAIVSYENKTGAGDSIIIQEVTTILLPAKTQMLSLSACNIKGTEGVSAEMLNAVAGSCTVTDPVVPLNDTSYPLTLKADIAQAASAAPSVIFNTNAEENGLGNNFYYLDGEVKEYLDLAGNGFGYKSFVLSTDAGDVLFSDMYTGQLNMFDANKEALGENYSIVRSYYEEPDSDYSLPEIGSKVRAFGVYVGYSEVYKKPAFYYGYPFAFMSDVVRTSLEQAVTGNTEAAATPESVPEPTPEPTPEPAPTPSPEPKKDSVYYSTNSKATVKKGNSGIYAYSSIGGSYGNYYIIDFDDGYVYHFTIDHGSDEICMKMKIESGDLNSVVVFTEKAEKYGLCFNWKNQPDHVIIQDLYGHEDDLYPTDLEEALQMRDARQIVK